MMMLLAVSLCVQIAYADETTQALGGVYRTFKIVGTSFAAVGIIGSGIQMLGGDTHTAAKAKGRILIILMAVGAMYLIPVVMSMGKNLFGEWAWTP